MSADSNGVNYFSIVMMAMIVMLVSFVSIDSRWKGSVQVPVHFFGYLL